MTICSANDLTCAAAFRRRLRFCFPKIPTKATFMPTQQKLDVGPFVQSTFSRYCGTEQSTVLHVWFCNLTADLLVRAVPRVLYITEIAMQLRVVTLNCWGLMYISRDRWQRIQHIGNELARGRFDIVTLQEIWVEKDYMHLCKRVEKVLPYHHYFHSGFCGSGMCIFSKWPIVDSLFQRFSLNSYAYRFLEGDWYGGKGIGLCVIEAEDLTLNVYTTHNTALHGPSHIHSADEHFADRLVQCYELSEFVRFTGTNSNVNFVTGDFNTEDYSLGLKVAKVNADLKDAWLERPNQCKEEKCCTVEDPDNCYTSQLPSYYVHYPGMRIDYILYGTKPSCSVTCQDSRLTFQQIPGTKMYYSDHTGVEALFELEKVKETDVPEVKDRTDDRLAVFLDAIPYINSSIQETKQQRVSYLVKSLLIFLLLTSLWVSGIFHLWTSFYARCGALVVIVALVVLGVIAMSIGISVKTTELNQLNGRKRDISLQVKRLEIQVREK